MFLDASAMIGIIAMEDDAASLTGRLAGGRGRTTSAYAIFEAAVGLARIANAPVADALAVVDRFLTEIDAAVVAIDRETGIAAVKAFARFGKGRHPAGLNMGDCFAYACAKQIDVPLLCKGNDFPRTDMRLA
ncbi:MAG TPA: type II toxin-antitoxin system VapC family toxin [Acetobacteraceae bacterium]|jgi:ribonuclease VapC|nr:type II toxin-antitoxin system VapC family toxin [Acetobacteraceae bacterium]